MVSKVGLIRFWLVAILSLVGTLEAFSSTTRPSRRLSCELLAKKQESAVFHQSSRRELVSSLLVGTAWAMSTNVLPAAAASNQTDTTVIKPTSTAKTSPPAAATTKPANNKIENPGDVKNCPDFKNYKEAKAYYDKYFPLYGDVARLDGDKDGIPCESLPGAPPKKKK